MSRDHSLPLVTEDTYIPQHDHDDPSEIRKRCSRLLGSSSVCGQYYSHAHSRIIIITIVSTTISSTNKPPFLWWINRAYNTHCEKDPWEWHKLSSFVAVYTLTIFFSAKLWTIIIIYPLPSFLRIWYLSMEKFRDTLCATAPEASGIRRDCISFPPSCLLPLGHTCTGVSVVKDKEQWSLRLMLNIFSRCKFFCEGIHLVWKWYDDELFSMLRLHA